MIPKLRNSEKILAINFGGIGDEILFLPTLKKLRQLYPTANLTLMVEPRSRSIEQITDLFDRTITFDIKKKPLLISDLIEIVSLIRDGGYELVISSGSSPLVAVLLFLGGSAWRVGYHSGALSESFLTHAVPLNRDQYAGNMYYDLADYLEGPALLNDSQQIPELQIPQASFDRMEQFLASNATTSDGIKKRILLHPGTSKLALEKGIIKTWDTANWIELIKKLSAEPNYQPILAGGPDDESIIAEITRGLPSNVTLLSSACKTKSLADLAALTSLCDLLVCVDSAPMHIAVGVSTPVVALFAPTDEKKLLPKDPKWKALRAAADADVPIGLTPILHGRGVQLQPYDVFQAVLDQLRG